MGREPVRSSVVSPAGGVDCLCVKFPALRSEQGLRDSGEHGLRPARTGMRNGPAILCRPA